jgi:hypothetical protein
MKILDSLKFVKNGYARKDLIPELTHYYIRKGRVTAYNGTLAFSSPIALDLDIAPAALQFHNCIEACEEKISMTVEKGDRLRIKSGKFKSLVKCISTEKIPTIIPLGKKLLLPADFVERVSSILQIIDNTSEKLYTQGLKFYKKSAYATNNIIMIELWLGVELPEITIPKRAIIEICKYKKQIDHVLISDDMIYFMYDDDRWIASKLIVCKSPNFETVLDKQTIPAVLPAGFWEAMETLSRFSDEAGKVTIQTGKILAGEIASNSEAVASVEVDNLNLEESCLFDINQFLKIKKIMRSIEFKSGEVCLFYGDRLRGAIVGYRK